MMIPGKPSSNKELVVVQAELVEVGIGHLNDDQEISLCLSFNLRGTNARLAPIVLTQDDAKKLIEGLTEGLRAIQAGNN